MVGCGSRCMAWDDDLSQLIVQFLTLSTDAFQAIAISPAECEHMLNELRPGAVKATHDFCDQLGLPGVKDQTKCPKHLNLKA